VLARASAHPDELALAVDASHAAMREASRRAARPASRGGLANAVFVVSSLQALPPELSGLASLLTVHFPWGSLLSAAIGHDAAGAAQLAALVAPGGLLRLLVSAAEHDAGGGITTIEPERIIGAYAALGMVPLACRPAALADIAEARSSWGKRLLAAGGNRVACLLELERP
jgi:16S rRNA (adenine(1408)-N(1))-methyltransferase